MSEPDRPGMGTVMIRATLAALLEPKFSRLDALVLVIFAFAIAGHPGSPLTMFFELIVWMLAATWLSPALLWAVHRWMDREHREKV